MSLPFWRHRLTQYQKTPALLPHLSHLAGAMCAPFWWSLQKNPLEPATILNNGSVCYVNTGVAELGASANHVVETYAEHLKQYGEIAVECQLGGSRFAPEKRLISKSDQYDLVTLNVPEVFVNAAAHAFRAQHEPLSWPPERVETGQLVLYGGYPGVLRENRHRIADFPFQWIAGSVSDVSRQFIVLEPGFETLTWLNPQPGQTYNRDLRGMSGGPVFRVIDEPLVRLELVGFIRQVVVDTDDAGHPKQEGHTVLATHADAVGADGSIVGH